MHVHSHSQNLWPQTRFETRAGKKYCIPDRLRKPSQCEPLLLTKTCYDGQLQDKKAPKESTQRIDCSVAPPHCFLLLHDWNLSMESYSWATSTRTRERAAKPSQAWGRNTAHPCRDRSPAEDLRSTRNTRTRKHTSFSSNAQLTPQATVLCRPAHGCVQALLHSNRPDLPACARTWFEHNRTACKLNAEGSHTKTRVRPARTQKPTNKLKCEHEAVNSIPRGHHFRPGHAGGGVRTSTSHDPKLVSLALPEPAALEVTLQADEWEGAPKHLQPRDKQPQTVQFSKKTPTELRSLHADKTNRTVQFRKEHRQSCDLYIRNLRRTRESISTPTCSFRPSKAKCDNTQQTHNLTRNLEAPPGAPPPWHTWGCQVGAFRFSTENHIWNGEVLLSRQPREARTPAHPAWGTAMQQWPAIPRSREGTSCRGRINRPSAGSPLADEPCKPTTTQCWGEHFAILPTGKLLRKST